jgi:hypothetical protein
VHSLARRRTDCSRMGLLLCITLGSSTLAPLRSTYVSRFRYGWMPRLGMLVGALERGPSCVLSGLLRRHEQTPQLLWLPQSRNSVQLRHKHL